MSWSGQRVPTACRALIILCCILGIALDVQAQSGGINRIIAEAESLFVQGETDVAAQLLSPALAEMTDEQAIRAYRILILSYLGNDAQADASAAVLRLLHRAPAYQPDPNSDPPAFVSFVNNIRGVLASAPEAGATCNDAISTSTLRYVDGSYEEAQNVLSECLNEKLMFLPEAEYVPALRLLTLLHLRTGDVAQARSAVGKLLKMKADYLADPVQDPPAYLALVEILKSGSVR